MFKAKGGLSLESLERDRGHTLTKEESASVLIGHLEQKLQRIEQQMDQVRIDVERLATSSIASQLSGPDAAKELGYSLRAELLRLQHELNLCESELLLSRAQSDSTEAL